MIIDKTHTLISGKNFYNDENIKKNIILGDTNTSGLNHFNGWLNRYNSNFKRCSHYTILKNGQIYEHFNPKYSSDYMSNPTIDDKSIIILLENRGYLVKDLKKNIIIDWVGNIYDRNDDEVYHKKWRGFDMWDKYTEEQFSSSVFLIKKLCYEFNIEKNVISHNTKINNPIHYDGILYKSNFEKYYLDLNPSWEFENFKQAIEND